MLQTSCHLTYTEHLNEEKAEEVLLSSYNIMHLVTEPTDNDNSNQVSQRQTQSVQVTAAQLAAKVDFLANQMRKSCFRKSEKTSDGTSVSKQYLQDIGIQEGRINQDCMLNIFRHAANQENVSDHSTNHISFITSATCGEF